MLRLIAALAVLSIPSSVLAKEIYVSRNTGDDENPGTKEKPRKQLWKVWDMLEDGDIVRVAEGIEWGEQKAGVMPQITKSVTFEGGWKQDFSERNPFKYLTIITAGFDRQGSTKEVFRCEDRKLNVTIDGFMIDRGGGNAYYSEGEMGANKKIEGHIDTSPFGYRNINRKVSGSDPSIELIGQTMTVRNNIIINSPWWGIYVKGGGKDKIVIENNLVLGFQGRGIEAITGGGWGAPTWIIRNNTVAFGLQMEGRGISLDPKGDNGKNIVEKNVIAFNFQTGVMTKFDVKGDDLQLIDNLFYFNKQGDMGKGGSGCCNVKDFGDDLSNKHSKNVHELPKFITKIHQNWFDRYTMTLDLTQPGRATDEDLAAARESIGLKEWLPIGFTEKKYASYSELPVGRANYDLSRYPHPMKNGTGLDADGWKAHVIPMLGLDGARGIQAAAAK